MNQLKHFIHDRFGPQVEYQSRIFYWTCVCGLCSSAFSWIMTFFSPIPSIARIASFCCFVIMLIIALMGFITKNITASSIAICLVLNFILFPITFFISGGVYSGMPIYFVMGIFFIATLTRDNIRVILYLCSIVFYTACFAIAWLYPDMVISFSDLGSISDILSTVIIVSSGLFAITTMTINEYGRYYDKVNSLNQELKKLADTDSLTGLYNRGYLINYISELIANKTPFYAILFDLDDFKMINDAFGHIAGDNVLIRMSAILTESVTGGTVSRYGGEEFMVVIPNSTDDKVISLAENIRRRAEIELEPICNHTITVSGGIHRHTSNETIDQIIEAADHNMYSAKHTGKNRIFSSL